MNLLKGFDYIFYRVYHSYKTKWKDDTPGAYATSLVTLLQCLIGVIIPPFLVTAIGTTKVDLDKKYIIGAFVMLFVLNYIRYFKIINYQKLAEKWNDEEKTKRVRNGIFVVLFIITIVAGAFVLATINFENNN